MILPSPTVIQVGAQPFDYLDPWGHAFSIKDAVTAISRVPRFGGHTKGFYSVAQHSVLVSVLCPARPWDGLAHDLEEAYIGDLLTPMKRLIESLAPAFAARLRNISSAVEDAFLSSGTSRAEVKRADLVALATERRDLLENRPHLDQYWGALPDPVPYLIIPLSPEAAERAWWARYWALHAQKKAPDFGLLTPISSIPPKKGNTP